jgi:hypothetical protein
VAQWCRVTKFNGAGSAVVAFGAPRIWHKAAGRLN